MQAREGEAALLSRACMAALHGLYLVNPHVGINIPILHRTIKSTPTSTRLVCESAHIKPGPMGYNF